MHVKPIAKTGVTIGAVLSIDGRIMSDRKLAQAFGARLKQLRKDRRWTQKELATKVGVRFEQLNKYEMGLNCPPFEKLLALADALSTSLDFLVAGTPTKDHSLRDTRLLTRFEAIQDFGPSDQEAIMALLDAMILKHRVQGAVAPVDKPRRAADG